MGQIEQTMQTVDWLVIAGYAIGMLSIGIYFGLKAKTSTDYLLGGRHMKSWAVGLSLFATLFSAISYMSIPGEIIKYGPMVFCGVLALPLVYWATGWFLIPVFMKLNITSANELLEAKLGISLRVLAAVSFLLMRLLWMSVVIYMCADKIIVPLMDWGPKESLWVSITIGLVTVVYTSMGGLKAVVLTDVIQTFILFGAAILSLLLIGKQVGGPVHWIPETWPEDWVRFSFFDMKARASLFVAMISTFMWYLCTSGSDQMAVQRYLATKDIKAARRGFLVSLIANLVVTVLLAIVGLGLLAYFKANPQLLVQGQTIENSADKLFPKFVLIGLPVGATGLVIAGLMAAAMSSLSSGVNSSCLVISKDFFERFSKKQLSEKQQIHLSKIISLAVGLAVITGSLVVGNIKGNILELTYKTANLLVAPLFVPFFMALFVKKSHERAVFWGTILSIAAAIFISFSEELFNVKIPFLWIIPVSLVMGVISSWLFSYIVPKKKSV
ncbi:MAG: sodium/solute symporter [Planctomycetes bacterium]|nr:sodium/solute symporter [Planctomycetota bacterium]